MNAEDPDNFNPKVLRYHALRRTNDDLEEVMRNQAFISPLMRDSQWDGYRWESTKKRANGNPLSLMRRQNHTKTAQDQVDDIRAASEPRPISNGQQKYNVRFNPRPAEPVEPNPVSLFSQRRMAMNRFLKGNPKAATSPRPRVTSLEAIAADVVSREDKRVSHFEKISRLSSSVMSEKLRWTKQRQSSDSVAQKEHFHEINKKELPRYEHGKSTLRFSGRNTKSADAYTKRRNLADIKSKLHELKQMNKEHRGHLADISMLSEEIDYDKKQAEMERHNDSHVAQSAIRQKVYTADLTQRRRAAPARSNNRFHTAHQDEQKHSFSQTHSPHPPDTVMGNAFSNSRRSQDSLFSPTLSNVSLSSSHRGESNSQRLEVAKALQAAAEARAALEREVVERAMAENAANEKLEKEAKVSASLREEVSKLQSSNLDADRERRAQRDEIRELRQSMNDLRASLSELIPGEVAELRATVTNMRASMVDLMGDARARLAKEDAEAVWKYLQNFMVTDMHAEDIVSDLDRVCRDGVDRVNFADFLRETGAESINSTVTNEVFRLASRSVHLTDLLSWADFIDMLRPHRSSRVPTPPLRESSLSRPDDVNFELPLPPSSISQSISHSMSASIENNQSDDMMSFRALFPPGSIGLSFMNIDDQDGIVVTHAEGAAMTAGVLAGDLIVEVNEEPLDLDFTEDMLFDLLMELPRPISIGFQRLNETEDSASMTLREDQGEEDGHQEEEREDFDVGVSVETVSYNKNSPVNLSSDIREDKTSPTNTPVDLSLSLNANSEDRNLRFSMTDDFRDDLPSEDSDDGCALEFSPVVLDDIKVEDDAGDESDVMNVTDLNVTGVLSPSDESDGDGQEDEVEFSQLIGVENTESAVVPPAPVDETESDNESVTSEVSMDNSIDQDKKQTSSNKKKNKKKKKGKK